MISPGQHRYIDVDGVRTHYVVAGQGPPVVFIHGLGASMVAWRENIVPLSERLSVYALDLAGHGDSEKPNVEYSISFGVRYMLHFLDALDLQQVALVGNSMGGTLALATALEHAERVNRLVLVDTASLGREVAFYLRVASLPMVGELFNRPWFGINRKALRSVFNDMQFITKDLQEELVNLWQQANKTVIFVTHNVEEAVFLGDRVVVMTARPGRIKKILEITLKRPRDVMAPDFNEIRREATKLVEEELKGRRQSILSGN